MRFGYLFAIALISVLLVQTGAKAQSGCDSCGCDDQVWKLVKTTRVVKDVCYGCECDEVLMLGCGTKGCTQCETIDCDGDGCDKKGCCDGSMSPKCKIRWTSWIPGMAKPKGVKKLVKYEVEKEVCVWQWQLVASCGCDDRCDAPMDDAPVGDAPPVPPAAEAFRYHKNGKAATPASVGVGPSTAQSRGGLRLTGYFGDFLK